MQIVEETKAKKLKADDAVEPISPERTAPATTTANDVAPGFRTPSPPTVATGQLPPPVQVQAQPSTHAAATQDAVQTEETRAAARKADADARVKKLREDALAAANRKLAQATAKPVEEDGAPLKQAGNAGMDCTS